MIKTIWGVTFCLSDLRKAINFYKKTLKLTKKYEYSSYADLEYGGVEAELILKGKVEIGENYPTVEFTAENFDRPCETMETKDVEILESPHDEQWGSRQMSFKDSDGNILGVVQINWENYFAVVIEGANSD
jgi:uncharacterized glyoxalase superfamily protein PhnB